MEVLMRYLLAVLVLLSACLPPPIKTEPTGVIVATRTRQGFAACEVVLGDTWTSFEACAGPPLVSLPWRGAGDGRCHFYETNTLGLGDETAAPFVAVCVTLIRQERRPGDVEGDGGVTSSERIRLVVGLRQIPADLAPLPY